MVIGVQVSVWMNCKQIEMLPGEWRGACAVATPITAWVPRCLDGHVNSAKIFFRILRSLNIRTISQTYEVKTLWVTLFASNAVRWLSHRVSVKKIVNNKLEKKTLKDNQLQQIMTPLSYWMSIETLFVKKQSRVRDYNSNKTGQRMVGWFTCEKWRHSLLWQKC